MCARARDSSRTHARAMGGDATGIARGVAIRDSVGGRFFGTLFGGKYPARVGTDERYV